MIWNDRSAVVPRRPRTTYSASSVRYADQYSASGLSSPCRANWWVELISTGRSRSWSKAIWSDARIRPAR